jgi:hypothetical protein
LSPPLFPVPQPPSASPAVARASERIARAFANPDGGTLRRARDALALAAAHPALRARYGDWAGDALDRRLDLAGAIVVLERAFAAERARHRQSRRIWGTSIRPRLALMVLGELRLLARFLRRHAAPRFPGILEELAMPVGRPIVVPVSATPE